MSWWKQIVMAGLVSIASWSSIKADDVQTLEDIAGRYDFEFQAMREEAAERPSGGIIRISNEHLLKAQKEMQVIEQKLPTIAPADWIHMLKQGNERADKVLTEYMLNSKQGSSDFKPRTYIALLEKYVAMMSAKRAEFAEKGFDILKATESAVFREEAEKFPHCPPVARGASLQKVLGTLYVEYTRKEITFENITGKVRGLVRARDLTDAYHLHINAIVQHMVQHPEQLKGLEKRSEHGGVILKTKTGYEIKVFPDTIDPEVDKMIKRIKKGEGRTEALEYLGDHLTDFAEGSDLKEVDYYADIFTTIVVELKEKKLYHPEHTLKWLKKFRDDVYMMFSIPKKYRNSDNLVATLHSHPSRNGEIYPPSSIDKKTARSHPPGIVVTIYRDTLRVHPYGLDGALKAKEVKFPCLDELLSTMYKN